MAALTGGSDAKTDGKSEGVIDCFLCLWPCGLQQVLEKRWRASYCSVRCINEVIGGKTGGTTMG